MTMVREILRIEFGAGTDTTTGQTIPVATFIYKITSGSTIAPTIEVSVPWTGDLKNDEQVAAAQLTQFGKDLAEIP